MSDIKGMIEDAAARAMEGSNAPGGQPSGRGRILLLVSAAAKRFDKSQGFMAFAFACLALLGFAAYRNHEPVATAIGILAVAVFGGGAWKNHADQAYGNGNGNGGTTSAP